MTTHDPINNAINDHINTLSQCCFINGQWVSATGDMLISNNPATGSVVWQGQCADEKSIDIAFHAAQAAFQSWAQTPLDARLALIHQYKTLLEDNKTLLADDIMQETGKPQWESLSEVNTMIAKIAVSINAYHERTGMMHNDQGQQQGQQQTQLRHRPHGVCAVFGPYNFPGHLPNGHIIPALIAGNTIVFKPSEQTPRVGERLIRLMQAAGFPDGVINFVPGELQTAKAITAHPLLRGFFFTGSSAVGIQIHRQFAGQPDKIIALEMGGNNPLIITPNVDIEAAVYHTIQSAFITAGQRCTCARRLIIVDSPKKQAFIDALCNAAQQLHIDAPDATPQPFYSTLINQRAADGLLAAEKRLTSLGGIPLLPMQSVIADKPYLSPGIIDMKAVDVALIPDEEYFGPLLKIHHADNLTHAIELANATAYGLSAGIFTDCEDEWQQFYALSHAGIINRNKPLTGASGAMPFGGTGLSGNHNPGAYYAADYCAYPVASMMANNLTLPDTLAPGWQQ
ncbi:succinylglutamate-semialdehyde dehydrogenase [Ostreibacterium oceani]|uniref:L-glutamate gamma-semialdehyde dehydrogenase n=1 Tax=Ostreibacterium oceani TaxID=2654998 RepID=A0A6N7EZI0_9GAMM|nr:succinylglutamate-semialdehyde dehydrogenase [Ostreibacterium oceani]MPV86769.1 succinylglutamate-semialdehyde dehydrogenase [Ostreibacterium oceani]